MPKGAVGRPGAWLAVATQGGTEILLGKVSASFGTAPAERMASDRSTLEAVVHRVNVLVPSPCGSNDCSRRLPTIAADPFRSSARPDWSPQSDRLSRRTAEGQVRLALCASPTPECDELAVYGTRCSAVLSSDWAVGRLQKRVIERLTDASGKWAMPVEYRRSNWPPNRVVIS